MVQPPSLPVRAVASVTLVGSVNVSDADDSAPGVYRLDLEKALYFGGLDEVSEGCRGGCTAGAANSLYCCRGGCNVQVLRPPGLGSLNFWGGHEFEA